MKRMRPQGGSEKRGRLQALNERQPLLEANFLEFLGQFTAGGPMREGVLWTNLSVREISRRLTKMGTPASRAQALWHADFFDWME